MGMEGEGVLGLTMSLSSSTRSRSVHSSLSRVRGELVIESVGEREGGRRRARGERGREGGREGGRGGVDE